MCFIIFVDYLVLFGYFLGYLIVLGVVLFDYVFYMIGVVLGCLFDVCKISLVKFFSFVIFGELFDFVFEMMVSNVVCFIICVGECDVVSGVLFVLVLEGVVV